MPPIQCRWECVRVRRRRGVHAAAAPQRRGTQTQCLLAVCVRSPSLALRVRVGQVDEILIDGHDCPLSGPAPKMEASCTTPKGTAGTKDVELRSKGKTCARCTQAFHYNGICTNINPPNGP